MKPSRVVVLCLSLVTLVGASRVHAQAPANPWSQTVAFPTSCYGGQDDFQARNQQAIETLARQQQDQQGINSTMHIAGADADGFEVARRMQEALMKDPQAAMKMMQQVSDPAALQAAQQEQTNKRAKWDADRDALIARFKAATKQAFAPGVAQMQALQRKLGADPNSPFLPEMDTPQWARVEYDRIQRAFDKEYRTICGQWFAAGGATPAFLKRYKDYLVQDRIPYEEQVDAQKLGAFSMVGTSTKGFKSTAALEAVQDYMKMAAALYYLREAEPRCTAEGCLR